MTQPLNSLYVKIENIRGISNLSVELDIEHGVYAITGENGSGKSTLLASIAVLLNSNLLDRIHILSRLQITNKKSRIHYKLGDNEAVINNKWEAGKLLTFSDISINGFYEGSINFIYGNRFSNNQTLLFKSAEERSYLARFGSYFSRLDKFAGERVNKNDLTKASDFIKEKLGEIMKNDKHHYDLFYLSRTAPKDTELKQSSLFGDIAIQTKKIFESIKRTSSPYYITSLITSIIVSWIYRKLADSFEGTPYFIIESDESSSTHERIISQFNLSTGENLMISLLDSIYRNIIDPKDSVEKFILILDEVELGFHPSALRRFFKVLNEIAENNKIAVYIATHSIELIRCIEPRKIYYLEKNKDKSVDVIKYCYPAYVTGNIYDQSYSGIDLLILVEDKLAQLFVERLLIVHKTKVKKIINTIPIGGWDNVLKFHKKVKNSNLLNSNSKVISILDGDQATKIPKNYPGIRREEFEFLPVESLEKFLREKIVNKRDSDFINELETLEFESSLRRLISGSCDKHTKKEDGKDLWKCLARNLKGGNENKLTIFVCDYIIQNEDVKPLIKFIENAL